MKILKYLGIFILGGIALILVAALFTKNEYAVERSIVIDRSQSEVFDYIKYLRNQDNFSKWNTTDPYMKKEFKGIDGTVGFVSAWSSENSDVGVGEQEIISINDGERIDYALRFFEPFETSEKAYMEVESVGKNQTKVIWGFKGQMDYPMNLMLLTMDFDAMLGSDFEYGLKELKQILEGE